MSSPRRDRVVDTITELLERPLADLGVDLEEVEVTSAGKRSVVRVAVDKDDGITLDDIADITREVSALLDDRDVMGEQSYTLEVGSRGVDRPLTRPRHWRRNQGRLVKVKTAAGETFTGRIEDTDDDGARLEVSGQVRDVAYAEVANARIQVEFN